TIEPPKPETDDRFDQDDQNNDLLTTATDLGMVGSLTLADLKAGPSHNDDDYKFTMVGVGGEDDFVQVAYQYGNDAQLAFTLYDANGAELSTSKYTPDGVEKIALSGLAAGDYYLRVYNNMSVNSFARYTLTFDAPQTAPAAPTNFKTNGDEATFNKTTLSWNDVAFETGYEIRYTTDVDATDDAATWTSAGTVGADVTEFTAENLAYGTAYKFQIRALRVADGSDGLSVWDVASDWVSFDFQTVEAPEPPQDLTAAPLVPETLTTSLTWTDLANELGYVVDLLDADGVSLLESPVELDADTTSWTTPALALGTTYKFQITALNNAGDATAELTFTTENVPNAPTGLKATVADAAETSATLAWEAATETGAEAVVAYVVTYTDGQTVLTQTVDVATAENPTTCQLLNLVKGATYDVTVVAVNAYGDSAAATVKFSTLETPSTVVTTLSDVVDKYDGEISLREAIAYAEADATLGTTITFDAEAYADELDADGKATIVLGGSQLVVSQALTIDGGENGVTVDANKKSRVLQVKSTSAPAAFKNLTLINGRNTSKYGAGGVTITTDSKATFENVTISGNSTTTDYSGGVYLATRTTAVFTNVTISQNTGGKMGGGVYVDPYAKSTFTNVEISGNTAKTSGGGVYVMAEVTTTFTNADISGNTAKTSGAGVYVYNGTVK
ncbi:MAG: fibronectin type III domain-containing protein, partial [Thermoguttaceae bacterium]|nr:fibronectin type III domain-containing protein [Thermoguttaceae bacterium]